MDEEIESLEVRKQLLANKIVARAAYHRAKGDPAWIAEHLERLLPLLQPKKAD